MLADAKKNLPLSWPVVRAQRYSVYHHADLSVTHVRRDGRTITLLGYAVDPHRPHLGNQELLQWLVNHAASVNELVGAAGELGGRWALLAEFKEQDIVMHDACGMRQVFYSDASISPVFCASQASTAAAFYDLEADKEAEHEFLATRFAQADPEYWWPGASTRYRGVRCLLPNHFLELRTRCAHRYAPSVPAAPQKLDRVVERAATLLKNLVQGASRQFELSLPLTAGWDSRVILSACCSADLVPFTYTLRFGQMNDSSQDLVIPGRILEFLGWKHHVIDCPASPTPEFAAVYRKNADPAHDAACAAAEGLQRGYHRGTISLSGHCSEVARCYYRRLPREGDVTARHLADLAQMDPTPFVLRQFEEWLQGARLASALSKISLLDLFYWEQRVGRWAANGQAQWDLVHERFAAFNCRPLLLTLLAADPRLRRAPRYVLYEELVRALSPDLLSFPINPDTGEKDTRSNSLRSLARRVMARAARFAPQAG